MRINIAEYDYDKKKLIVTPLSVEMHVSEVDREYLDADLRDKLEERSKKRKMNTSDELVATKVALQKITDEMKRMREEMDELRKEKGASVAGAPEDLALGFCVNDFLTMSPTGSLQWVSSTLVPRLKQEISRYPDKFRGLECVASNKTQNVWTCAGFNRGKCNAKWHVHERPAKNNAAHKFKDLRLHSCVLCYEAFGILVDHPMINCPWIKISTWANLEKPIQEQA